MTVYITGNGTKVRLGAVLGKGGEGTVHAVEGEPGHAAKLYLSGLAAERRDKIAAMVAAGWHAKSEFVAFPVDTLFDRAGVFAGFTMRKVGNHKAVHQLYSPTGRKSAFPNATYPFLVRTVSNIARAMANVHATGCVVGDVNHSGVLVAEDATVVLIDCDSFQVTHAGRLYPCRVGVPEFTPPELQGKRLDQMIRTANHDAFGLAILVFYTLIMGRHPFAGRYLGSGDMSMDRAIAEFRFAYSGRRAATQMEPPPHVPTLADLPITLGDAFEQAFGAAGANTARPSSAEWVALLDKAEGELVRCASNPAHHYFRVASSCPWCRMERSYPGFQAFAPALPIQPGGKPLDLGQLIAAVRGVPDPGPAPVLASLMPVTSSPPPDQAIVEIRKARLKRFIGAIVGASLGAILFGMAAPGPIFGLLAIGASAVLVFSAPAAQAAVRQNVQSTERAWRDAEHSFARAAGNELFLKARRDAEELIKQLQLLPTEERRRLAELDAKRSEAQLRRYLEQHTIEHMKVKGVGNARKLTLRSYGIETAADVERYRIEGIHGFGPSTANALVAWRRTVEAGFRFDPKQGVSPLDIAAVTSDISRRQADAEMRLRQTTAALRKAASDAEALRASPGAAAVTTWRAWKQSDVDAQALKFTAAELRQLIGVSFAALLALYGVQVTKILRPSSPKLAESATGTMMPGKPEPQIPAPTSVVPEKPMRGLEPVANIETERPGATIAAPSAAASLSVAANRAVAVPAPELPPLVEVKPSPEISAAAAEPVERANLSLRIDATRVQERLKELGYFSGLTDGIWGPRSRAALREFRKAQGLGIDDHWDATQSELFSDRAVRAKGIAELQSNGSDALLAPPPGSTRNPLNRADALWVQGKLRELGFHASDGEGVWGDASREALRDFKAANGLPADEIWDAATERLLSAAGQLRADQTFIGAWANSPGECRTGSPAPVTITSRRAEAFGGVCEFVHLERDGGGWWARARCKVENRRWHANVRLSLIGNRLVWSSEKGTSTYYRCL